MSKLFGIKQSYLTQQPAQAYPFSLVVSELFTQLILRKIN